MRSAVCAAQIHAEIAQGGEAEAIATLAEGAALPSRQKLRFLFGVMKCSPGDEDGSDGGDASDDDEDNDEDEDEDED